MNQRPDTPTTIAVKKQMVSPKHAAEMLDVCPRTIRRYIKAGRLPATRITSKTIRIRVADIEALQRELAA